MTKYNLNSDLAGKIEYLRDKVKTLNEENARHKAEIQKNNKILNCVNQNLKAMDAKAKFKPANPWNANNPKQ